MNHLILAKARLIALAVFIALAVLVMAAFCKASATPGQSIRLEAGKGKLTGVSLLRKIPGYTGEGYAGEFAHEGDKVVFLLPHVVGGFYSVRIRYSSPYGEKGYELAVNGLRTTKMFRQTGNGFAVSPAGKAELRPGVNSVEIGRGWGYFDIDSITLIRVPVPALQKPPVKLADPNATAPARKLMAYLVQEYGAKTLSGQYEVTENNYIHHVTGKMPAIYGGDFMDYSPSRVAHGKTPNAAEQMLTRAKAGQIITAVWHWNAPEDLLDRVYKDPSGKIVDARWWRGFYANATTFDVQKAMADPKSRDYALLLRDMDVIAAQLAKLQSAGIPVLWRPLHEAPEGGFWWGAKGPEAFKKLWHLMYYRYTVVHHLHNLIWVCTIGSHSAWYPGSKYVDIVGTDEYPQDAKSTLSSRWQAMTAIYGGKKLIALTEFGGVPDLETMRLSGVRWSYFVSWFGNLGPEAIPKPLLTHRYHSLHLMTKVNDL